MSNLTPQDVDVKLTATRNELAEEDARLWEGLEDEKVSRIAGDEANKQFTMQVQGENASTESRLSTEVIHRSEGDLTNITSLNALAVALSEYRIKTDLEITNEKIARQQLGVDLNTRVDYFVASWDHEQFLLYQAIQTVQADVNNKYSSMDVRIRKYENMLQDITTDSIQITMDNGEINMGAWTILSQAREWDLEILTKVSGYQDKTTVDLNQALEDLQNKLPIEQDIIDKAIEQLSNAPIITKLDKSLSTNIGDVAKLQEALIQEALVRQQEILLQAQLGTERARALSQELKTNVLDVAAANADALAREASIRAEQLRLEAQDREAALEALVTDAEFNLTEINKHIDESVASLNTNIAEVNTKADGITTKLTNETTDRIAAVKLISDGLTSEITNRVAGDTANLNVINNYKLSNDTALANVQEQVTLNTTSNSANATKISALDVRLTTNDTATAAANSLAATAVSKAETALTENTAQASQISGLNTSIESINGSLLTKADASALTALDTKVTNQGGLVTSQGTAITKLTNDLTALDTKTDTKASSSAVSALDSKVTSIDGRVTSQGTSITTLTNRMTLAEGTLSKKAESSAVTSLDSKVTKQGLDITSQGAAITRIDAAIDATNLAVATKASAAALSTLDSKVTSIDGKVSSNTSAVTSLTGRVTATEEALTTKASVDAVNSLTTRITSAEGTIASQATSITSLNSGLVTTNTNVTAAQTAANKANTLAGGKGKVFFQNAEPAVADRLVQNLWIDTTGNNNTPKRWLTNAWVAVNDKIATDALKAANAANVAIATKADASALSSLDSKVTSINGTVTSQGVSITNLNTRLSSAEGALTTKANSSAVSSLDSKVTQQGNTITSQGTDITKLKADLDLTNTAVSTKASSEALQSLDNRVVAVDGRVTTNASAITTLSGKMTTVENGLATKAEASALSNLATRVGTVEGGLSSASSNITNLQAGLTATDLKATAALPRIAVNGTNKTFRDVLLYENKSAALLGNIVIQTPITFTAKMFNVNIHGYHCLNANTIIDVDVGAYAYSGTTYLSHGAINKGTMPIRVRLGIKNSCVCIILTSNLASLAWSYPKFSVDVEIGYTLAPDTWKDGWTASVILEADLADQGVTPIFQPSMVDVPATLTATATALTSTNAEVTRINGVVVSQGSSITTLQGNISTINGALATKADGSAVTALTTRVKNAEGVNTTQSGQITTLTNNLATTDGKVANKAESSAVSSLDSKVTGIDGRVTANTSNITSLSGRVTTTENGLATKADTSAVNALTTRVGNVEGGLSTQASDMTALKSSLGLYVLPTDKDTSQQNKWARITLRKTQPYIPIIVVPDYSYIGTYPEHSEGYFAEGATTTLPIDNSINYYRTLINVTAASTINLGNLMGNDAHAIYVDGKEVYRKTGFSTNACSFEVTAGDHVVDIVVNNGIGVAGFSSTITMSSQVTSMYAPKLTGVLIGNKAEASAIQTTNTEVSRVNGVVVSQGTQLTNLNATLTTLSGTVNTKADAAALTSLTTRVTNAEGVNTSQGSSITSLTNDLVTANTAINTKASSAAVATLDSKVTAVDGKVVANTNDLTVLKSTVDNNQAYIINNYYTKTAANTATANHITQFKSTLYVGARNLLINSDFRKGLQGWETYDATVTINNAATIDNKPSSYAYIRGGVGGIYKSHGNIPHKFTTTEDVTFSLMVSGNGRLRLGFNDSFKDFTISDTVNWTRITHTQKGVPNSDMVCYLISGTYIDVAYLKVELGSIPTEWSPAPEDDIRDIETTATAVNSISTQVAEIDGKVTAQASQVLTLESFTDNIINGVIPGNKVATVNLTAAGYDRNTWYPVAVSTIKTTERTNLAVYTVLNQSGAPPWATHASGFSCNLQWSTLGSGWGVNQVENNIEAFTYAYSAQSPIMGPRQLATASKPYVWLRGGGTYKYSLPQNNTLEICQPNGTIAGIGSESVGPIAYNANTVPLSVVKQGTDNSVQLQQTNEVVDGVKAVSTVSVDNNGFISGYGLISQLVNGVVQSAFGVNADYFYVGTANSNKKKPFMVLTSPQTIGGVSYPAGTWMDVALIANATIGTAHIQDASITNAKIKDLNADKITAGTLNANRIGANSITAEKLVIGDTTNLWGNQYFETNVRPNQSRTAWFGYKKELKGRGVQMWGRDHMAPYSTRIPLKTGDEFVIEFTAGLNTGAFKALGVGLWVYDATGSQGTNAFQFGVPEQIATLGDGWYRYRRVFTVADNGSGLPAAYGTLYFQIPQSDTEANPTYWTAGDVVVRKRVGGELIVNGAITADKLSVNQLSAVSATIGTLRTSTTGARTEIRDNLIQIFDSSNRVRVKIGVF